MRVCVCVRVCVCLCVCVCVRACVRVCMFILTSILQGAPWWLPVKGAYWRQVSGWHMSISRHVLISLRGLEQPIGRRVQRCQSIEGTDHEKLEDIHGSNHCHYILSLFTVKSKIHSQLLETQECRLCILLIHSVVYGWRIVLLNWTTRLFAILKCCLAQGLGLDLNDRTSSCSHFLGVDGVKTV